MLTEKTKTALIKAAESFGAVITTKTDKKDNANTVLRDVDNDDKVPFFAFIRPEEETKGVYSDYSLVIFPSTSKEEEECIVSLAVGSLGFKNDYDLAALPWTRRLFLHLINDGKYSFCKTSFADIESSLSPLTEFVKDGHDGFRQMKEKYGKLIVAAQYISFGKKQDGLTTLKTWLAQYATLRSWPSNEPQRRARDKFKTNPNDNNQDIDNIKELVQKRHYIVLQGAPGTGKTFSANQIAAEYEKNYGKDSVFFVQFHAETTYSDFVYGIEPVLYSENQKFKPKEGALYNTIKWAQNNTTKRALLIIDEINRANLSNVLGPVFYLFENDSKRSAALKIGEIEPIKVLPSNIDVIATMNTADRSLAVVDFALRRRFAWYTLKPHKVKQQNFHQIEFERIAALFFKFASDEELNLQPGQSYFMTKPHENINDKITYELMPLIKEYLNEGYMAKAKDAFDNLFYDLVGKHLFE